MTRMKSDTRVGAQRASRAICEKRQGRERKVSSEKEDGERGEEEEGANKIQHEIRGKREEQEFRGNEGVGRVGDHRVGEERAEGTQREKGMMQIRWESKRND